MTRDTNDLLKQLREQSHRLENESYVVVAKALMAAEEVRAELDPDTAGEDPAGRVIESQLRKLDEPSDPAQASPDGTADLDWPAAWPPIA